MKIRTMLTVVMLMVFVGVGYSYSSSIGKISIRNDASYLGGSYQAAVFASTPVVSQDQEQQPEPEGDRHCAPVDPNDPNGGAVDKSKIGCSCERKCVDGKIVEAQGCKVHCKPENCDCKNPCAKS